MSPTLEDAGNIEHPRAIKSPRTSSMASQTALLSTTVGQYSGASNTGFPATGRVRLRPADPSGPAAVASGKMLAEACRIVYDYYSRAERNSTGSTPNPCTNNSLTSLCMGKEIQTDADWKTERDRLNREIIKLEASLIEAKEVTRVNLTEEISDEFTNKLREAKRERVRIEDDFEDATAQWRNERRRAQCRDRWSGAVGAEAAIRRTACQSLGRVRLRGAPRSRKRPRD